MKGYQPVAPQKAGDDFITLRAACDVTGCSAKQIVKLAGASRIGTWSLGLEATRVRYSRLDCERVRDSAFTPATN